MRSESSIDVQVHGQVGIPDDAVAVVLNVTVTETEALGFVTVSPTGAPLPNASNVNIMTPGQTRPNLVTVPIGAGGQVSFSAFGGTHVLGDVTGYITDESVTVSTSGLFVPLDPVRVFDTREEEAPAGPKGYVSADSSIDAQVAGAVGIPSNAGAVVLNVTGVASPIGFITVWPTGIAMPTASTLNFAPPSDVRANAAMVPVGAGGQISFDTFGGADILADTAGYFLP